MDLEKKNDIEAIESFVAKYKTLREEIAKVIVGQDDVVKNVLMAMFSRSHALLIGVPGLAKTLMITTIAKAVDMSYNRIQFTPDLMPSDIMGAEILDDNRNFKFVKGPIFANIVLADEINRTPPKTQSALLEAMQERSVSMNGTTYALPNPFFVLATQNPIEQEGTYPLPEAQQDRFMFNIMLDYPSKTEEEEIVKRTIHGDMVEPQRGADSGERLSLCGEPLHADPSWHARRTRLGQRLPLMGCRSACIAVPDHRRTHARGAERQVFA